MKFIPPVGHDEMEGNLVFSSTTISEPARQNTEEWTGHHGMELTDACGRSGLPSDHTAPCVSPPTSQEGYGRALPPRDPSTQLCGPSKHRGLQPKHGLIIIIRR